MADVPKRMLSAAEISSLTDDVIEEAKGSKEAAWHKARPLLEVQQHQREAVMSLLQIVDQHCLPREAGVATLSEIAQSHHQDIAILAALGQCLESARDIDDLNSPPPVDTVFYTVVERLSALAKDHEGLPEEEALLRGLATSARMLARQRDDIAENSLRRLLEISPQNSANHYNMGLFLKTRGRFEEGMRSNQTAASLTDEKIDAYEWNLGICATGAGNGAAALEVWKRMGQ